MLSVCLFSYSFIHLHQEYLYDKHEGFFEYRIKNVRSSHEERKRKRKSDGKSAVADVSDNRNDEALEIDEDACKEKVCLLHEKLSWS